MPTISAKRPNMSDGTGVNYKSLHNFVKQAKIALQDAGEENAAHYFEMFQDHLEQDVLNGKPFGFTYRVFGL